MENRIQQAVKDAKEKFNFPKITGNIFEKLSDIKYFEQYGLLIFKEYIGKLSGFIAYPTNDIVIICINYNRSLGHQNFTIAHELGHYFLHDKKNKDDYDENLHSKDKIEIEANEFANQLLYSSQQFEEDYEQYIKKLEIKKEITIELCDIINELCHKYCVSFEFILAKICYKEKINLNKANKEVKKLTKGIAKHYDIEFYWPGSKAGYYKRFEKPYELLKKEIIELLNKNEISKSTAESILYSNEIDYEDINDLFN